jgi:hypothetical protein
VSPEHISFTPDMSDVAAHQWSHEITA